MSKGEASPEIRPFVDSLHCSGYEFRTSPVGVSGLATRFGDDRGVTRT